MHYIGIDIGTTTISGLLSDDYGNEIKRMTRQNTALMLSDAPWQKLQSPNNIYNICMNLLHDLAAGDESSVRGIGITGQMHGIVYLDKEGKACSELISWQDERGNASFKGNLTYCQRIYEITNCHVATGFGLTTLFYDTVNGLVPKNAKTICTITDYVAMRLSQRKAPLVHASNAASMGMFSLSKMSFDIEKISALGIDISLLPEITTEECIIGSTESGIAVTLAIGDNQASYLGSVGSGTDTLINIGTGSQISCLSDVQCSLDGLECRPYINNKFLLVGSSLCGGSAYNLLLDLFAATTQLLTGTTPSGIMQKMDIAAAEAAQQCQNPLKVDTRFRGTRSNSRIRGAIENISISNFTPGNLCYSFLLGVCEELHGFYMKMKTEFPPDFYAISGNAVRNSSILRLILEDVFGAVVRIPNNAEEAAFGAALLSIHATEGRAWNDILDMVRYIDNADQFADANIK